MCDLGAEGKTLRYYVEVRFCTFALGCLLVGCQNGEGAADAARPLADSAPFPDARPRILCPPSPAADHMEWCFSTWGEVDTRFAPTGRQGFSLSSSVYVNSVELGPEGGLLLSDGLGGVVYALDERPCRNGEGLALEFVLAGHPQAEAVPFVLSNDSGEYGLRVRSAAGLWQVETDTSVERSEVALGASATAGPQYLGLFFDLQSGENLLLHENGDKRILERNVSLHPPGRWRSTDQLILGRAGLEEAQGWLPWTTQIHYVAISCMPLPESDELVFVRSPV